jgi:AraC-like DNA-binding protein
MYLRFLFDDGENSDNGRAEDDIESHFKENLSIKTLAEFCNLSESHFFTLFKKQTGLTPIQYKHNLLVQNAIDMLTSTDKTIEEISEELNFSSSNYFRKIFTSITGHTPKEYR